MTQATTSRKTEAPAVSDPALGAPEVDMASRNERILALPYRSEHARALAKHWLEVAGDRLCPRKSDLRPECLKAALPHLVIYEFHSADDIRFRLAGTATRRAYKRDLTGLNYLDFVPDDMRQGSSERLHAIIQQPAALLTHLIGPAGKDIEGLFEIVGFPLCDAEGDIRFSVHSTELLERGSKIEGQGRSLLRSNLASYHDIGAGIPVNIPGA